MLTVETPMGILRATRSNYANHPGIWIELQRQGEKEFDPLVLVEYTNDEEGLPDNTEAIITKVWENHTNDEYSVRVIHDYAESIIAESTPSPYEEEFANNWKLRYRAKYAEGYEYGVDKVLAVYAEGQERRKRICAEKVPCCCLWKARQQGSITIITRCFTPLWDRTL